MKNPAIAWVIVAPTAVMRVSTELSVVEIADLASSIQLCSCASLSPRSVRAQSCTCEIPSTMLALRSSTWVESCWPTRASRPKNATNIVRTTMNVATRRGIRRSTSQSTAPMVSAVPRTATAMGTVISEK